ncbi:hypothetical protein BGX21_002502 [Mortierella sp. AD011]|nr:hypothetical protein BGX20_004859 [Mortierella sp. AD010]KAF9401165.1 hypothetical protein BGX21_002502 [Mortierella sp. AD011]
MLDSFAVRHKLSRGRATILRVTTFITLVAITTYNYITTCTQYYDSIFSQNCNPTLIPAGSQFLYRRFTMTNGVQLLYNASKPQNCSLEDVVIQSWFAATALPTFKINMHMTCDNDFNLTVNDFTFDFWNEDYNTISQTAGFLRKFSYCTSNTSAPPYDALEYKYNSTFAYNGETYWNNIIRLFNDDGAYVARKQTGM